MIRQRTHDRAATGAGPPHGVGGMHTVEQIGPKRHRTKEGYLLCEDVCIARTGFQMYGRGETPVRTNDVGYAMIERDAATLFHPVTMLSFQGKPVTNDHPYGGVSPSNWKNVSVGSVLNVRRGTGNDSDTMRADLLITDAKAIMDVEAGKREVSAGYECDYQVTGDGEGRQLNIVGNHVALVTRARCGPRCSIGDKAFTISTRKGKSTMPQRATTRASLTADQRAAIMSLAGPGEEEEDENDEAGHVHVHLHQGGAAAATTKTADAETTMDAAVDARFNSLEGAIGELTKAVGKLIVGAPVADASAEEDVEAGEEEEDEDAKKAKKGVKTGDSAALATGYLALTADAEVLVPGFKVPKFNATADRKITVDQMCAIRRKVIDHMAMNVEGAKLLATLGGGQTVDSLTMDCKTVATMFRAAAGAKKLTNNAGSTAGAGRAAMTTDAAAQAARAALPLEKRGPSSIAEVQELNRKAYPFGSISQA